MLQKIPGVVDVRWQGGAGDHGADILVTFEAGLPIPGLENEYAVVVQVKSFEGEHWDTRAVEDIRRAFEYYPEASMGLIISTASASTTVLDNALDKLKEESGKPIALLIGPDVAAFLLRFGAKLLG
ncbi:MAG TPA: restriction endonuclease [Thermodesulfobacteriota bacterium]|nr:restriction endonuclease [Thermodesulfobacteriota bacterium]